VCSADFPFTSVPAGPWLSLSRPLLLSGIPPAPSLLFYSVFSSTPCVNAAFPPSGACHPAFSFFEASSCVDLLLNSPVTDGFIASCQYPNFFPPPRNLEGFFYWFYFTPSLRASLQTLHVFSQTFLPPLSWAFPPPFFYLSSPKSAVTFPSVRPPGRFRTLLDSAGPTGLLPLFWPPCHNTAVQLHAAPFPFLRKTFFSNPQAPRCGFSCDGLSLSFRFRAPGFS